MLCLWSTRKNVLEAALAVEAHYQDYAGTVALHPDWVENYRIQFEQYGPRFEAINRLAIIGTGSAPGLICAATRDAAKTSGTPVIQYITSFGRGVTEAIFAILVVTGDCSSRHERRWIRYGGRPVGENTAL